MATDIVNKSELDAFQRYIDERCGGSLQGHSLTEAIEEFREYQQQLFAVRERLRISEESAEREGTMPLTEKRLNELCDQWKAELKEEGVIE